MITVNVFIGPVKLRSFTIDDSDIDVIHHYMPRNLQYDQGILRFEVLFSEPSPLPKQIASIDSRGIDLAKAYRTLGLRVSSPAMEMKARYRQLVKEYHPDNKITGNISKYREVVSAYNLIVKEDNS